MSGTDGSLSLRPLRREEYEKMVEVGLFADEHIELIDGMLVAMSPQGTRHSAAIDRLSYLLIRTLGERARVRVQMPFALDDLSEPEPDLTVVPWRDYDDAHPTSALLVIEVAESSAGIDRGRKATLYAGARVPEYWVVNVAADLVEVYTQPSDGRYAVITAHRRGATLVPRAFPDVAIAVADVLRQLP